MRSDGYLWSWGINLDGRLGDGTTAAERWTPVKGRDAAGTGYLTGVTKFLVRLSM